MFNRFNGLGPKVIIITSIFLLLLAGATAALVTSGFQETKQTATQRSVESLEQQGRDALQELTEREANLTSASLRQGELAGQTASEFMVQMATMGGSGPAFSFDKLKQHANGAWYDPNPNRISEVWMANHTPLNDTVLQDMRDASALDALFPTLKDKYPDMAAISYVTPQSASRYYPTADPVLGLAEIVPPDVDLAKEAFFAIAAPESNPERKTVWTPPYVDLAGQGLLVTATTPVYSGDTFRGDMVVDISLNRLIEHLNTLKTTPNGYAFLLDQEGHLIAAPHTALQDLTGNTSSSGLVTETLDLDLSKSANQHLVQALGQMRTTPQGGQKISFGEKEVFLAYSRVATTGWTLVIAAPVGEVTAQSANVTAAISSGTDNTVRTTLLTTGIFFLLALIGAGLLNRRLTRPISALVEGTRAVAAGNLDVAIPVKSNDELGVLAQSFNTMTSELKSARQRLTAWNEELEQTVSKRTAELAQAKTEAEEARALAERAQASAEEASVHKSQFLANMSHELRTPLNSIINFTRIIDTGVHGEITPRQHDYLTRVRQSGEHLLGLINDILDLSKIEAGRTDLYKEPLNIRELVDGVMSTAVGLTKDKPIELLQELAEDLPTIQADRTRIRQVLLNLLSNAAKFTHEGSIIVRAGQQDEHVMISVTDTGIGIAPEHQSKVFEEFQQVEGELNRRYEGTGLGLSICRKLVELHGGTIELKSVLGEGSTFTIRLPIVSPEAEAPPKPQEHAEIQPEGQLIMVIDDDMSAIEIVTTYLASQGYAIHGITDSRTAVEEALRIKPAAVLLDILMPHKDGWEVLAELKGHPETKSIPIALYSLVDERKLGFYLGASAYLIKPIDEDQLRSTVTRLIAEHKTILVVDDDANSREIVRHHLQEVGAYRLVEANNGLEGLQRIAEQRPDLIILDLMMPEVDGFALLNQLDEQQELREIPVVVITAKSLTQEEQAWLNKRVQGLITKGTETPDLLVKRVNDLLHSTPRASGMTVI